MVVLFFLEEKSLRYNLVTQNNCTVYVCVCIYYTYTHTRAYCNSGGGYIALSECCSSCAMST